MSTELQKSLAEAIVKNAKLPAYKRKNKKELLVSTGYAVKTATSIPARIIEQKGVKDALREWGLTEELVTTALVADIQNKPAKRLGELSLGAEILHMKKKDDDSGDRVQVTPIVNVFVSHSDRDVQNRGPQEKN